jgi:hypothetical protein|tara:strand:- start:740 stop:952 length:213 start_codon:yes stop_codon:yes gene_type:complete
MMERELELKNDLSSALCDAYDIKDRLRAYGIKDKPKDAEGSDTTIGDCIDDIIIFLEQFEGRLEEARKEE